MPGQTQFSRRCGLYVIGAAALLIRGLAVVVCADDKTVTGVSPGSALPWTRVPPSANAQTLEMLAQQTQGNYEAIRTWTGSYSVHREVLVSDTFLANLPAMEKRPSEPLIQDVSYDMYFAMDIASGRIYRSKDKSALKWLQSVSSKAVKIPRTKVRDERSVVDAEQYLHFAAKNATPASRVSPLGGKSVGTKRLGYRDPPQEAKDRDLGDLMDPRLFYCCGSPRTFWDWLGALAKGAKEYSDALRLDQAAATGGTWYRLVMRFQNGGCMIAVFSPEAGFNPVSLVLSPTESGQDPTKDLRWEWKRVDGIYVPGVVEQSNFSSEPRNRTLYRKATLVECAINRPLDPEQFTYQALGMKDGDLVVDNIAKRVYALRNGALEEATDLGNVDLPEGVSTTGLSTARQVAIGVGLLVLLLLVVSVVWRHRRSPSRGETDA